ncbi:enolase 4 [Trichomycterus rosablanca]|uniref:enolase 4 n=1 Tax=Trichomycterus rosablanca TaxID=2290929 RepID=UPI002F356764
MSFRGFLNAKNRISKEDKEFNELKNKAAEYYRANGVPQRLEDVLSEMFMVKPRDIYGYLANYFSRLAHTPTISAVVGREVYDSRGEVALQVDVYCIIRNEEKLVCSAVVNSGNEDVMDSGNAVANGNHRQASVAVALEWIREHLSPMLHGVNPGLQTHLDKLLSDFYMARYLEDQDARNQEIQIKEEGRTESVPEDVPPSVQAQSKDKKGGEKGKKESAPEKPLPPPELPAPVLPGAVAVAAVSLAVAKTAAALTAAPLYKHIITLRDPQALSSVLMPTALVTVFSCGKTSAGKLNLLEEVILLPTVARTTRQIVQMGLDLQREVRRIASTAAGKSGPAVAGVSDTGALQLGFDRPEQALDLLMEACTNLDLPIGTDLRLLLNLAAHTLMDYPKGKYEVMSGTLKSPDELVDMLVGLVNKYPAIVGLIDPLRKEDVDQWQTLSSLLGQTCVLIADASHSPHQQWQEARPPPPSVTWVTLGQRSEMTLTDLLHAVRERTDVETILALSSEDMGDVSMVDVAVGLGVSYIKLGGLDGCERMNKYNRLQNIERELQEQGILARTREVKLPCVIKPEELTEH